MGSMGILVIGDDYEDQLDKFQNSSHAEPENRHWVISDELENARRNYEKRQPNSMFANESFFDWVQSMFNIRVLEEQQKPDLVGLHHNGWMRLNERGEVVELMHRTMRGQIWDSGQLFDYVSGFSNVFPLKKDRVEAIAAARERDRLEREYRIRTKSGFPWEREPQKIDLDDFTFTHSAALRDIDFDALRLAIRVAAEERWDYVASACGSQPWVAFDEILGKYSSEKSNNENHAAAYKEWEEQTAVQAIHHAMTTNPFESKLLNKSNLQRKVIHLGSKLDETRGTIDRYRVDKQTYVNSCTLNSYFRVAEVIMNGEHLKDVNLDMLLASIPEDSLLTDASVRC